MGVLSPLDVDTRGALYYSGAAELLACLAKCDNPAEDAGTPEAPLFKP